MIWAEMDGPARMEHVRQRMAERYRKPPPVSVGSDTVCLGGDITYHLLLTIPLLTGQDTTQVPLRVHPEGMLLADLLLRHLPPAERRAAQAVIDRARERLRRGGLDRDADSGGSGVKRA